LTGILTSALIGGEVQWNVSSTTGPLCPAAGSPLSLTFPVPATLNASIVLSLLGEQIPFSIFVSSNGQTVTESTSYFPACGDTLHRVSPSSTVASSTGTVSQPSAAVHAARVWSSALVTATVVAVAALAAAMTH